MPVAKTPQFEKGSLETDAEDVEGLIQIVGVAADTRYADLRSETPPTFYVPYLQRVFWGRMVVEVRTASNPAAVLQSVRETVQSLDRLSFVRDGGTMAAARALIDMAAEGSGATARDGQ